MDLATLVDTLREGGGGAVTTSVATELVELPFEPLPALSTDEARAVEAEALRRNDRYIREAIEGFSFCPYAHHGRKQNRTRRFVYHADKRDLSDLFALMSRCASEPTLEVVQVIFPRVEISPEQWTSFCFAATAAGHARMEGPDVLACAPLHPELPFDDATAYGLVPLFRRAPDPTIQWVRLDALDRLYKGDGEDRYVDDIKELGDFMLGGTHKPLYDRVCDANAETVERLGIEQVVALLADIADDGGYGIGSRP